MQLSAFIKEALTEIAFGVHEAKVDCNQLVAISPGTLNSQSLLEKTEVEFDIAVTVASGSESGTSSSQKGSGKINVYAASAALDGDSSENSKENQSHQRISRIAFKVPVYLNAHFRGDAGAESERQYVKQLIGQRQLSGIGRPASTID